VPRQDCQGVRLHKFAGKQGLIFCYGGPRVRAADIGDPRPRAWWGKCHLDDGSLVANQDSAAAFGSVKS